MHTATSNELYDLATRVGFTTPGRAPNGGAARPPRPTGRTTTPPHPANPRPGDARATTFRASGSRAPGLPGGRARTERAPGWGTDGAVPQLLYAGARIERMQQCVGDYLAPFRLRPVGTPAFHGELSAAGCGEVVVAVLRFNTPVYAEAATMPPNAYHIMLVPDGNVSVCVDDQPVLHGSHVVGPGQRVRVRWRPGVPVVWIRISRRLVERVWRDQHGSRPDRLMQFEVPLSPIAARNRLWESLASAFLASFGSGVLRGATPADARFGQLLAHSLLNLQPQVTARPTPDDTVTPAPTADAATLPSALVRAQEYCRTHLGEPLSVTNIAEAAGMSVRRLQACFRTHLGTTPIGYVKTLRLAGVHEDLRRIAAGVSSDTVTEVAVRWGFTHLGRFSGTYRAEFGRLPSQTAYGDRAHAG